MAVREPAGFHDRNSRKRALLDVIVEVDRVLDMLGADSRVGHDGGVVLERVADVAVLISVGDGSAEWVRRADCSVIDFVLVFWDVAVRVGRCRYRTGGISRLAHTSIVVPLVAIILPRNVMGDHVVANARRRRRWNRKYGVERGRVGVCVLALAEEARVVIVEQVKAARFTAGRDVNGVEVAHDVGDAILSGIRAIAVGSSAIGGRTIGTTAVTVFGVPVIGARQGIGVFNFVEHIWRAGGRGSGGYAVRRLEWVGLGGIIEIDRVTVTEHDVVGAGAAID